MERIVIYGAGADLKCMLDGGVKELARHVAFIVDGDKRKEGTMLGGMVIKDKSALAGLEKGTILAISSKRYYDEIERQALEINEGLQCILLEDYVNENLEPVGICDICHHRVRYWAYAGSVVDTQYPIIGNGQRSGKCPYCGCVDRVRWGKRLCQKETDMYQKGGKILHFAPEGFFAEALSYQRGIELFTADIVEGRADHVVDITNIQFETSFFDYCIANHVLEHIPDEEKAIRELQRVTKPDGKIILSFPVCMEIDTLEDEKYNTDELKIRFYGQEDHVRLYGKDFKQRLEKYGLKVNVFSPCDFMSKEEAAFHGLLYEDIVLICENEK